MSKKLELQIIAISYSQTQTGAYALILGEQDGQRRLPIIIGAFEAQSIAIAIEKIKSSRPLTHDLFKSFAEAFTIGLQQVIIDKYSEGIFFSKLVFSKDDVVYEIDSRTSDAVALAIRFGCPIYTYESVLEAAGIPHDTNLNIDQPSDDLNIEPKELEPKEEAPLEESSNLKQYSIKELKDLLEDSIDDENYERASQVRDELNRRSKK